MIDNRLNSEEAPIYKASASTSNEPDLPPGFTGNKLVLRRLFTAANQLKDALNQCEDQSWDNPELRRCYWDYLVGTSVYMGEAMSRACVFQGDAELMFSSPDVARSLVKRRIGFKEHEVFLVIFLDHKHRMIAAEEVFRGTLDGASIYPREVVKRALAHNAGAVIFAHNHPSGVAEPSQADRKITDRLVAALDTVSVRVLDHLVVTNSEAVSFAERGWV